MSDADVSPSLRGWTVVCLRPREDQDAAARAIVARRAAPLALPALELAGPVDIDQARSQLQRALACAAIVFTSPAAVRFAARLAPLEPAADRAFFCVGSGTARALASHGIEADHPGADAMQSEGLLALSSFSRIRGRVGLVTAPGGRGVLLRRLAEREIDVVVAEVYRRLPARFEPDATAALLASDPPRAVLATSEEALRIALAGLPDAARTRLLDAVALVSSTRLGEVARDAGFAQVVLASLPEPGSLLDALLQSVTSLHSSAT